MSSPERYPVRVMVTTLDSDNRPDKNYLNALTYAYVAAPDGYLDTTGVNSGAVQECQGGPGHNSWYGSGQVDALNAVTHASGGGG